MSFSEKMIVMMNPNRAFKVYMFHKDKRVSSHIVLPKEGKFKLKGNGYIINPTRVFFEKKIPCSVYSAFTAEPINPLDINERSSLSSQDFYNAIEATVVQDIIRSTGKMDTTMLMAIILMGAVSIIASVFVAYYLGGMIEAQNTIIANLYQAIQDSAAPIGPGGW